MLGARRVHGGIWLQTIGTILLVVKGGSTAHMWTSAHDSRSADRLLYLAAVRDDEREQADWGRIIGLASGSDLGFPEESLLRHHRPSVRTTRGCQDVIS